MTVISFSNKITADGEYEFLDAFRAGRSVVMEVSGTFGSGTATFGFKDAGGAFQSYKDSAGDAVTCTANGALEVVVPASGVLAVKLAGATAPSLTVGAVKRPI
jgi:hypothetical protein